jgi:hypothetical protein
VESRRLADQQVRAWVGERLAALDERLALTGEAATMFGDVLYHCQFGDQHVIKALEDPRFGEPPNVAAVEAEDTAVVASAAGSEQVDAAEAPAFIAGVDAAMRHRTATIVGLKR